MGPKYNVATCLGRIKKHQSILEEQTSFEEGQSAKPGPTSQIGAVGRCEVEGKVIHSFNIYPKATHGSQIQCCNMRRRIGEHQISYWRSKRLSKRVKVPNLSQAAKSELLVTVKWRERPSIPSIYAKGGPKAPHGSQMQCSKKELGHVSG